MIIGRIGQVLLGLFLLGAGVGHLTFARDEFRAQVPSWFPLDPGLVIAASGIAEITLGLALLTLWRPPARRIAGFATAAFFVVIFPGNIAQFAEHKDGFGLTTDTARAIRLLFQPLLVLWALTTTGAWPRRHHQPHDDPPVRRS